MRAEKTSWQAVSKLGLAAVGSAVLLGAWAAAAARPQSDAKEAAVKRGRTQFGQSCGFCHGPDATGGRGPDLIRSALVAHDQKGELIGEVVRNGRPDKGMPAIPATEEQISDMAAFLHARALEALRSSGVPKDYPAEKLLTGNADAGKAFFEGAGGCKSCHSPTGDLAGVAAKYSPVELEARMLYPEGKRKTATVTLASGEQIHGTVHADDRGWAAARGGWYRSFSRSQVSGNPRSS
jgi:cytochrome c oxidase cbb3-type subunit 3